MDASPNATPSEIIPSRNGHRVPSLPRKKSEREITVYSTQREAVLFAEYYLQGHSAYKSAILCGFEPDEAKRAAYNLLNSKVVQKILQKRTKKKFQDLQLTTEAIIVETSKLAFSNMLDYVDILPDGSFQVNLNNVTRDMGAAIQELSYDMQGRPKLKLADKRPAQELMMRYFKLLVEQENQENRQLTIENLDKLISNVTINQQVTHNTIEVHQGDDSNKSLPKTVVAKELESGNL